MLSGLFKPGWQHSDANKRLQALQTLDIAENKNLTILVDLAMGDPDLGVRKSAIGRLPPRRVAEIMAAHTDAKTRALAEAEFDQRLSAPDQLLESELSEILSAHPETRSKVATLCQFASIRIRLVEEIREDDLLDILALTEYTETRRQIAERLQSLSLLESARKLIKGKDKTAEKIIKTKIDDIRLKQRKTEENHKISTDICQKMAYLKDNLEILTTNERKAEFKRRFLAVRSQWDSLDFSPDEELKTSFESAFAVVSDRYTEIEATDQTHNAQSEICDALEQLTETIASYALVELITSTGDINKRMHALTSEWKSLTDKTRAELLTADRFFVADSATKSAVAFAESVAKHQSETVKDGDNKDENLDDSPAANDDQVRGLEAALANLNWPKSFSKLNARTQVESQINEIKERFRQQNKALKDKLDKIHKRINQTLGAARRGEIARARRELESISKSAQLYTGKDKRQLDDRIAKAEAAIEKMGDWKDFATEPKYIQLCESMEALTKSNSHPDRLAEDIKNLQEQWKHLGHSDAAESHWERFKAAADLAFEPCAKFFSERRDTRKQNLENREKIHQDLQSLFDKTAWDEQPDYKHIESKLRQSMADWKKIKDVDPSKANKQWKRYAALRDRIQEKLAVVYESNMGLKEQLVQQAQTLNEAEITERSLTQLQQLQTRWKQIGITRRKDDQRVWKSFKATTDEIYNKIKGIRQSKRDEESEKVDAYRKIIRQIQTLAKSAQDLAEADHSFEALQANYATLPALPKDLAEKSAEGLSKDYARACQTYSKRRDQILEKSASEEFAALKEKARLCADLERIAASGSDERIEQLIADIEEIPMSANLAKRFQQRLETATNIDRSEATEQRRLFCIDLEIMLNVDSPEEDRNLRMQIQFDRMKSQGLGKTVTNKQEKVDTMKIEWLCMPGADPSAQAELNARFEKLVN